MFKIEDIKAGYLLVCTNLREGRSYNMTVIPCHGTVGLLNYEEGQLACCAKGHDWAPLCTFAPDLTCHGVIRIDAVYGRTSPQYLMDASTVGRELLWKRDDTKRMTLEEIEKALGHKVKIVKAGDPDPNLFKKSNLYAGMVVQTRSGRKCLVVPTDEGLLLVGDPVTMALYAHNKTVTPTCPLSEYLDGLVLESGVGEKNTDIVRIWGRVPGQAYAMEANTTDTTHRSLVWKRDDTKRMTLEEIAKALGHKVEVVETVNK